ncbi:hypothetical protein [Sulfitobacter sabulilitoris]|uniref:RiboL-PSP-HEPN domain-containing protein n=1 Tax=Sulfitobacter sabulilitoris TaxID=2562655 RepID=A0A5S3PQB3_9RHOB|nr:hypothetical protein [Sulfitobacter sabulilitoris]TMM54735.1 hypothetical protein FDT80_03915 [Sulfitobacter sabulilitoris]
MKTKAFQRFTQRIGYYDSDIELCDLLVKAYRTKPNSDDNIAVDLGATDVSHPVLAARPNTRASRNTTGNHLRSTVAAAYIKDLYEDFSEYISEVMAKAAVKGINPNQFVGDVKLEIQVRDILAAGSWDNVVSTISAGIFRKLENERNTRELIRKASVRLGLNVDNALLNAAMPYLDARHILVHRDGKTDQKYRDTYATVRLRSEKIVTDLAFAKDAKVAVKGLAADIDTKIIAADLVRQQDLSGNAAE